MRAVISTLLPIRCGGTAAVKVNLLWQFAIARDMRASRASPRDCCLGPDEGRTRSALLAKKDKPFQSSGIGAGDTKKARSVVALSRVPR